MHTHTLFKILKYPEYVFTVGPHGMKYRTVCFPGVEGSSQGHAAACFWQTVPDVLGSVSAAPETVRVSAWRPFSVGK